MILIQSYSSPAEMTSDKAFFAELKKLLPNLRLLFKKSENTKELRIYQFLWLALKANFMPNHDRTIIGWGGDVCLYSWLVGRLLLFERNYLTQNMIIDQKMSEKGLKNKIRFYLYRKALSSKNFFATVNAPELIDYYADMFGCDRDRFKVVHDHMTLSDKDVSILHGRPDKTSSTDGYVFCGGKASRDINTFLDIVELNPDIRFKCVFPSDLVTERMKGLSNLEVSQNLTKEEFNRILGNASICCIPLKSQSPCGLLVMQHAAMMGIPIVSTETFSMRTVVPDDNHGFLFPMGDAEGMAECVRRLMMSPELQEKIGAKSRNHAKRFEPATVALELSSAINEVTA